MDVDDPPVLPSSSSPPNAIAGPSNLSQNIPLYLPPPAQPRPRSYFTSTDDLLSRFHLLPAYDQYVRPYAAPISKDLATSPSATTTDKGKGKEKEVTTPAAASTPGGLQDGDDDESNERKKKKNNYRHLIKGIPGKHSMKKDDYLTTMIQVPPKQKVAITPFDVKTQRDAFAVSLDGIKGWNINTLVEESPQAREDRKKRKELKKLGKVQAVPTPAPSGAVSTPGPSHTVPTPASTSGVPVHRSNTPRPGALHPGTGQPPGRVATPASSNTPRPQPTSSHPLPTIPAPIARPPGINQHASTPSSNSTAARATPDPFNRGKKRERDESSTPVVHSNQPHPGSGVPSLQNGTTVNGTGHNAKPIVSARAGVPGARPRPIKRQRMEHGQSNQVPVQQPTPQGV
ncbi:hypothetical protein JAAARDRAFT_33930 [Jaapia argillacea MUCL 33604]|uniref:Mediator of RNA polymerase II transcription subunit 19 n=1 Tax=Jaapia argillacea MUCL 33604 TaxID=933084 RepID=A0A067PWJ7_9AGAM|nr:hypothetical protein JAAARDRAFT_33930 [Jaapia argillacea MUCL 33604]